MHTTRLQKFLSILANLAIVGMELRAIPLSWDGVLEAMPPMLTGGEMPAWVRTLKYTVTCCLMLTFLTVVFVLAPMYGPDGHYVMLLTSSMLYNHFLNPVTALLSFVLLERAPALPRRAVGRAMIPTLVYGGIMLAANVARVYKGPYPFLYVYEQPLWTSCMWVVVILGGALLIAWAVWKLGGGRAA